MDVEHSVSIRIEDCAPIRVDGCVPINVDEGSANAYVRFDRKAEASAARAALCQDARGTDLKISDKLPAAITHSRRRPLWRASPASAAAISARVRREMISDRDRSFHPCSTHHHSFCPQTAVFPLSLRIDRRPTSPQTLMRATLSAERIEELICSACQEHDDEVRGQQAGDLYRGRRGAG